MRNLLGRSVIFSLVVALVLVVQPASARDDVTAIGIVAGITKSGPDFADDGTTFGLRVSPSSGKRYGIEIAVGYLEGDLLSEDGSTELDLGYEAVYLDVNETLFLNSAGKVRPVFTVGVGWAWPSLDRDVPAEELGPLYVQFESDTFTVNSGFGLDFWLGKRVYMRPEVRAKWFEVRRRDDVDFAATVGLGFTF